MTRTRRRKSLEGQGELYAQGRTAPGALGAPGQIVTNAPLGYSFHNYGLALDVVPTDLLVLPRWGDTLGHQSLADRPGAEVGVIGKAIGFRWDGDFRLITDRLYFEWSGKLALADLRRGARPEVTEPHQSQAAMSGRSEAWVMAQPGRSAATMPSVQAISADGVCSCEHLRAGT